MVKKENLVENNIGSPIFIVGLPRSGSTFLLNLITTNPGIMAIGELLFLTPWRRDFRYFLKKSVGDLSSVDNIVKMTDLMFSGKNLPGLTASFWQYGEKYYNHQDLKDNIVNRLLQTDRSLENIFKAIVEEFTKYWGYTRFCAKFPVFVKHVPDLIKWYPDCKILHLVRDPRAMAMSRANFYGKKRLNYRKAMVLFATMQYIWTSKLHEAYQGITNYALVRYEDLIAQPEHTISQLCDFTCIDFTSRMLEPEAGQVSSITGEQRGGFDTKAMTHWRNVISPLEEKFITVLTRNSMKRFGYPADQL